MSRDRDPYGPPPPRREAMMSRRDDYPSPREDHYSSKERYDGCLSTCAYYILVIQDFRSNARIDILLSNLTATLVGNT